MALASPTYPDSLNTPTSSFLSSGIGKSSSIQVTGDYTSLKTTEYFIRISSLTEGVVTSIQNTPVSGPGATLPNATYTDIATTTLTGTGSGLKVTIEVKSGNINSIIVYGPNVGSGYSEGDTFKVLGNAIGGATTANDTVFKVSLANNKDLKYQYKFLSDGYNSGWSTEVTAAEGFEDPKTIGNGLEIAWGSFIHFTKGEEINFSYGVSGTVASNMHVLNTKDGAHLLRYQNGELSAHYNLDKAITIDQNSPPDIPSNNNDYVGVLSPNSESADFAKINSKSVAVGLGGDPETPPKWVGLQMYKQFKREFNEDTIIIEDAELKISTEIPQLDDLVFLDTANWYDAGGTKGSAQSTAWTAKYWAGFQFGKPDLYIFRVVTDVISPRVEKVLGVTKYGIEKTGIVNPKAIATDGPHLFVLDKAGLGGLLHCFKFTGSVDSGEATCPKIDSMEKYNSNWPQALPDTPRGIAILNEAGPEEPGAGAWYSDILVTPSDSSMNTATGGNGRIWVQASWNFNEERDYAPYMSESGYFSTSNNYDSDAWFPVICGHGEEAEWLWSINLANPAHPTGMVPDVNQNGRLKMDNRSPALDKFYKQNQYQSAQGAFNTMVIRGAYDITATTGSNAHPQEDTEDELNDDGAWMVTTTGYGLLGQSGLSRKIDSNEAGIMQTLRWGLVDIQEDTKIGVVCLYSATDKTMWQTAINGSGKKRRPYGHLNMGSKIYAEIASSSAYYASSFVNAGLGTTNNNSSFPLAARDRLVVQSGGDPKEVEVIAIPADQVPTFNIIDGTVEGFTQKPLMIPLAEDCIAAGYTDSDIANDFGKSLWGISNFGQRQTVFVDADVDGRRLLPTSIRRVLYNTDGSGAERLVTFDKDGTIKTYDLSALYAANSLQTGAGANSWGKTTFLRKNPFDEENDNIEATSAGNSASELLPGGITSTGDLTTATGLIQHPTANGMNFGQSGADSRKVCKRDATKYEVDLYSSLAGSSNFQEWEDAYGAKGGLMRIMILPSELPSDKQIKINYNSEKKETHWDYTPTSIYNGARAIVFNQRKAMISYVEPLNLDDGIKATSTTKGFAPQVPYFTVTGYDNVGNGAVPADSTTSPARASNLHSSGKSQFIGWAKKDFTPDSSTTIDEDVHLENSGERDWLYYTFCFVYDGHQESPLSEAHGSTVDTDSGWSVQKTGDGISIKLSIPDVRELSKRISHVNFYRSRNKNDPSYAKAFYQLIEQVALDDSRWVMSSTDVNMWELTITDIGKSGETYETRTGVSELLENTQPHYGISCQGDGYLFVSQAWHQTLDDESNYIFRSKPGKHNVFDWATDWCELPEYPTALGYYNGKLFAFSKTATYMINPRTMTIEEDILQCGCISQNSIISCDYGMVWADNESIWMYNGVKIRNIGLPIEQGGDYSYRERDRAGRVSVEFDSISKSFVVFMKSKRIYDNLTGTTAHPSQLTESSNQAVAWLYHAEKQRWDYWILKNTYDLLSVGAKTLSTCRDWNGGVLYTNETGLYQLGTDKGHRKNWSWVSKNFVMGYPTLDKRFYKIRAVSQNGTPVIEYKVDDALVGLGVGTNEKVATKKGKRIKVKVRGTGETAVDSIGIIYRKPKAK